MHPSFFYKLLKLIAQHKLPELPLTTCDTNHNPTCEAPYPKIISALPTGSTFYGATQIFADLAQQKTYAPQILVALTELHHLVCSSATSDREYLESLSHNYSPDKLPARFIYELTQNALATKRAEPTFQTPYFCQLLKQPIHDNTTTPVPKGALYLLAP